MKSIFSNTRSCNYWFRSFITKIEFKLNFVVIFFLKKIFRNIQLNIKHLRDTVIYSFKTVYRKINSKKSKPQIKLSKHKKLKFGVQKLTKFSYRLLSILSYFLNSFTFFFNSVFPLTTFNNLISKIMGENLSCRQTLER